MTIAWVGNWTSAQFVNNAGGTLSARTTTAGNHIEIGGTSSDAAAAYTCSAGTVLVGRSNDVNGTNNISQLYVENCAGGSNTVTITTAANKQSVLCATETSGLATSSSLDKTNVGTGTSTTPASAATATTSQANELLTGYAQMSGSANNAWGVGGSWTLDGNITDNSVGKSGALAHQIVSATGAYATSFTWTGASAAWVSNICTYKAAGGAAPTEVGYDPARGTPWGMIPPTGFLRDTYSTIEAPAAPPLAWAPINLGTIPRRLPRPPRARRAEPIPPQFNPPIPIRVQDQTRRLRGWPVRRSTTVSPVPPQFNPPLPLRPVQPRTLRGWPVRRGRQVTPVPPQVNPPINFNLPQHRLWATLTRRGRAPTPVPPQQNPPLPIRAQDQSRRLRGWPVRRSSAVTPVPIQQAAPTNPNLVSRSTQRRLVPALLRRGRQVTPVPPQAAPLPTVTQHRLWPTLRRRGSVATPVPPQINPPIIPPRATQRRLTPALLRRGGRTLPVPPQSVPLPAQARRAPRIWRPKTRQQTPVPVQVVVANPPLPMKAISIRRLAGWLLRRNRKAEPGWPQGVNLAIPTIVYPTAFELLDNSRLDFTPDPSILTVELDASSLVFEVSPEETKFTTGESAENIRLG